MVELFNGMANTADETSGATAKSVCIKLLMNTFKRDISGMETSYELASLPLYRCSHHFQKISFTGSRVLERNGAALTKSTPLDKYLQRPEENVTSWYSFVCNQGNVPVTVISSSNMRTTWPLTEDFSRYIGQIGEREQNTDATWTDLMLVFFKSDQWPNYGKANVKRAKQHNSHADHDDDTD